MPTLTDTSIALIDSSPPTPGQLLVGYDLSNYLAVDVAADGSVTIDAVGTAPSIALGTGLEIAGPLTGATTGAFSGAVTVGGKLSAASSSGIGVGPEGGNAVISHNSDNARGLFIGGGSSVNSGANIIMYGGSHATLAGDFIFRNNTATVAQYDSSAAVWTFQGNLTVSGTGPHAIGGSTSTSIRHYLLGAFTATGVGTQAYGIYAGGTITGQAALTSELAGVRFSHALTTPGSTVTITDVAQMVLTEPAVTVGTGDTITNASTLKIANAPTEGVNNYALWVALGTTRLDGNLTVSGAQVTLSALPTSDPAVAGRLWNDSGTVKVSAG